MTEKVIIAGAGGQGIMLLGRILAEAAMRENKQVTWLPAYGAEVRGGTAHCMITISSKEIGSPYIKKSDSIIVMNQPSWDKFKGCLASGGIFIANSSLVEMQGETKNPLFKAPFTETAIELGNIKVANMVALGFYAAKKKIISMDTILETIKDFAPEEKKFLLEVNKQALLRGLELTKDS